MGGSERVVSKYKDKPLPPPPPKQINTLDEEDEEDEKRGSKTIEVTTLLNTQREISLPGFLLLDYPRQFRKNIRNFFFPKEQIT